MKKRVVLILSVIAICIILWIWHGNTSVKINEIIIENSKLPLSFNGFRIAQVSDLHNCEIGRNNEKLINKLKETDCDIIVMTGDMIDSRITKVSVTLNFMEKAVKIAPVYYVTGNHEARAREDYEILKQGLKDIGVRVLENEAVELEERGEKITLIGLHDTGFDFSYGIDYLLKDTLPDNENYKILLAHRPEYFEKYKGVDLVFSGHAHGGQIRLPFIGGIFAPGQGFLPEFDGGVYNKDDLTMVVSRGIGNSLFPVRINNNPELVVVELQKE